MSADVVLSRLQSEGARLELSLRGANLTDEHRRLIREHKAELIGILGGTPNGFHRLPWQLERLLRAASHDDFKAELPDVRDVQRYTLAWGCAYLTGDRMEAERRLWEVYWAWQRD